MLDDAAALHLRAFVVGQQPVGDAAQDARICELSEAFAAICALRGVPFAAAVLDWLPETPLVALTPAPGAQPIPHPYRFAAFHRIICPSSYSFVRSGRSGGHAWR